MNTCMNCKRATTNTKFCSRSCAASCNNRLFPKRRSKANHCKICGADLTGLRRSKCNECLLLIKTIDGGYKKIQDVTKAEYQSQSNYYQSRVRLHARKIASKFNKLDRCAICGYNLHVECAHIKSISSFPGKTPVRVINSPSNLIGLCPNHHWEQENGLLKGLSGN